MYYFQTKDRVAVLSVLGFITAVRQIDAYRLALYLMFSSFCTISHATYRKHHDMSPAMEGGEERRMHSMEGPCIVKQGSVSIRSEQIC
jgi:phosphatidylglycerophosphate synthase